MLSNSCVNLKQKILDSNQANSLTASEDKKKEKWISAGNQLLIHVQRDSINDSSFNTQMGVNK